MLEFQILKKFSKTNKSLERGMNAEFLSSSPRKWKYAESEILSLHFYVQVLWNTKKAPQLFSSHSPSSFLSSTIQSNSCPSSEHEKGATVILFSSPSSFLSWTIQSNSCPSLSLSLWIYINPFYGLFLILPVASFYVLKSCQGLGAEVRVHQTAPMVSHF